MLEETEQKDYRQEKYQMDLKLLLWIKTQHELSSLSSQIFMSAAQKTSVFVSRVFANQESMFYAIHHSNKGFAFSFYEVYITRVQKN